LAERLLYAAGPGNAIGAHKHWEKGDHDPTQMTRTFSGQFANFCRCISADAYIVAHFGRPETYSMGQFTIEHRPKPMAESSGLKYHLSEILYGIGLFQTALRFRADAAIIESGTTYFFVLLLFRLANIKVIAVLHNTLWPAGYPPIRPALKFIRWLDSFFFRWGASATIGVSPECLRQVRILIGANSSNRLLEMRGQFFKDYFSSIPSPPPHSQRPFQLMYAGRVTRDKGVFDILEIAKRINDKAPGLVNWNICGHGPDFDELNQRQHDLGLESIVTIRGFVTPIAMREIIGRSHASIVPTRSTFAEGMAMSAVEPILAGRPVITNRVVPALEVLRPAAVEAATDDVESYTNEILHLANSAAQYSQLCNACTDLQAPFFDLTQGYSAALAKCFF
jgi:glycogen(starch) synthase